MSSIPIIQGQAMPNEKTPFGEYPTDDDLRQLRSNPIHKFQDLIFAVIFWVHLVVMIFLIAFGLSSRTFEVSAAVGGVSLLVSATGVSSLLLCGVAMALMMRHAEILVKQALLFSLFSSMVLALYGLMIGDLIIGGLGLLAFALGICYTRVVWPRIPYAAANLKTALAAVRLNMGLIVVSLFMTVLASFYMVAWSLGLGESFEGQNYFIIFLFFLSFYWVREVLQNTMHVTTAGVVGTWWFIPAEANNFCSKALNDSLFRSLTYSFGSICFGSLLVAIIQALRALERYVRDNDDFQIVLCIIQCILACIEAIVEYVNRWAYVYVGLYGFSYLQAGRNVLRVFEDRGWSVVVTDDLIDNVFSMIALGIGLMSGLIGLLIGSFQRDLLEGVEVDDARLPAFIVGLVVGLIFASIMLSVVSSAVATVIVLFAEDPASFEANHPQLSFEMRNAWAMAWPLLTI